ncbi:MAG: menaquinone biosynthesis protein [Bacteroidota bacterium]
MSFKITAVNYLNTFPFRFGLEAFQNILNWTEIDYATPFECAQQLLNGSTNIALAPIAVLAYQPNLQIITNYCLSTNVKVQTVKLYSHQHISHIKSIVLDYQSLSSVSLCKVLMKHYWKKNVEYIQGQKGFENQLNADAMVVIGDRTFELNGKFPYEYDLAEEWFKYFGKPFVFAAWISNVKLSSQQLQQLNNAFEYGIQNIEEVTQLALHQTNIFQHLALSQRQENIYNYLTQNMQYYLTPERKESIEHFLNLLKNTINEPISVL